MVMTSQCLYGRVGMYVYDTGRDLQEAGVLAASDMLPETAMAKLMWVLGTFADPAERVRAFSENLAGEINERIGLEDYA